MPASATQQEPISNTAGKKLRLQLKLRSSTCFSIFECGSLWVLSLAMSTERNFSLTEIEAETKIRNFCQILEQSDWGGVIITIQKVPKAVSQQPHPVTQIADHRRKQYRSVQRKDVPDPSRPLRKQDCRNLERRGATDVSITRSPTGSLACPLPARPFQHLKVRTRG